MNFETVLTLSKREFFGYFRSPVAYVFMAVFVVASVGLAWFVGQFFDSNQASMVSFFTFIPWVYVVFIPAVGMRLWAEEKRYGTWELLFTLPVTVTEAVLGKFLAAWAFVSLSLLMTFVLPATVCYLGDPDLGLIFSGYAAAILMAAGFLSICSLTSALTKNQVISFVLGVIVCFILVLLGFPLFHNLLSGIPVWVVDMISNFSFMPHFYAAMEGVVTLGSVVYYVSISALCLFINIVILER